MADSPPAIELGLSDRLYVPYRKRMLHSYAINDDGVRELRIDYGIKEISFDEERLFPFAEGLINEPSFTGSDAISWGPGYEWGEIQPLLQSLVEEGVLRRGNEPEDPRGTGLVPSPLPPARATVPRMWSLADCEALSDDLGGRPFEIGWIEAIVPLFRIAHPAMDADDRQVGEANVVPKALRLDRPTEWRVCQYAGSRYRDPSPMNVTALKAMIKHWKPIMAITRDVRAALHDRLERVHDGWTIGDLFVLSCVVLGLPSYQLLRRGGASPQPPLHPILSSLFRITDGIRMTTATMLFKIEETRRADEKMTGQALLAYAEHGGVLVGNTGVCAGPTHMLNEFLGAAVDGTKVQGIDNLELPAEVKALMDELPAALDYSFYAMKSWAVSLSIWLAMARTYERLIAVFRAREPDRDGDSYARLRARLMAEWDVLEFQQITLAYDQDVHFKAYQNAYEQSWRALAEPVGPPTLAEAIALDPEQPEHAAVADELRAILRARFAAAPLANATPSETTDAIDDAVRAVVDYARAEQKVLASATAIQAVINQRLERPTPVRALTVADLRTNYFMDSGRGSFPYVFEFLEHQLGVRVECTATTIKLSDLRAS